MDERIQKMKSGYCDAMILARAGLDRLGLSGYISNVFGFHEIIPSACQGFIALETRSDSELVPIIYKISDPLSFLIAKAERQFLGEMQVRGHHVSGCIVDPGSDRLYGYNVLQEENTVLRKEIDLDLFASPGLEENTDRLSDLLITAALNMVAEFDIQVNSFSN